MFPQSAMPGGAPDPISRFYMQIFTLLDRTKSGVIQGQQVFAFFMTSGIQKGALAEIWDEAKQKKPGGLSGPEFIVAMNLIWLAQNGIAPKRANLAGRTLPVPKMQYPPQLQIPVAQATQQPAPAADPFSGFGIVPGRGGGGGGGGPSGPSADAKKVTPSQPNWNRKYSIEEQVGVGGAPSPRGASGGPPPSSQRASIIGGGPPPASSASPHLPSISANAPYVKPPSAAPTGGFTPSGMHTPGGSNRYGPQPSHLRKASTRNILGGTSDMVDAHLTRKASRNLYEQERYQEQLRAAEAREKYAKQQANETRISNEKLTRENELLKKEIADARASQSTALKQSQEALGAIQPLRLENDKLKEAVEQWTNLITSKDEELEVLVNEVDALRADNERFGYDKQASSKQLEEIEFKYQKIESELQESQMQIDDLKKDVARLENEKMQMDTDKVSWDLERAKLDSEVKRLNRELHKAKEEIRIGQKEKDMFGGFNMGGSKRDSPSPQVGRRRTPERAKPADDPLDFGGTSGGGSGPASGGDDLFASSATPQPAQSAEPAMNPDSGAPTGGGSGGNAHVDVFGGLDFDSPSPNPAPTASNIGGTDDLKDGNVSEYEEYDEEVSYTETVQEEFGKEYANDPWFIPPAQKKKYHKYFLQADLNKDGFINGSEANKFFSKSKLDRAKLAKIWTCVDTTKRGKLTEFEFYGMFHMVFKVVQGKGKLPVPSKLPDCLSASVIEKIGTMVEKKVTKTRMERKRRKKASSGVAAKAPESEEKVQAVVTSSANDAFGGDDAFDNFGADDFGASPAPSKGGAEAFDPQAAPSGGDASGGGASQAPQSNAKETTSGGGEAGWDDFGSFDF